MVAGGTDGGEAKARLARHRFRLPGPALAILYVAACTLPLGLAMLAGAPPASRWEMAGAALALVALPAMAIQVFISGRFETASGQLGIDRVMAFHKLAAWGILVAMLLHPLLYVVPTLLDDTGRGLERLRAYVASPRMLSGVVAWVCMLLLVVSAALRNRLPLTYEAWRAGHVVLALAVVVAGLNHAVSVGRFSADGPLARFWLAVGLAVGLAMAILYGLRWLRLHTRPWRLSSVTKLAERTWELDIQAAAGTPPLPYQAGQFVWMTEGRRRFPLFDHPFSIADSPLRPGLSLIVKEAGDFTGRIGQLAPGTAIGIDGPHGDFVLEDRAGDAVLLVAGGVGIAPIMGLLRDLVARGDARPVRLAYAAGSPAMFACLDEIEAAGERLDLQVMLVSETAGDGWAGDVGRLDRERLASLLRGLDPATTIAMMCGPGGMITAVSDMLVDLGLAMDSVVYERFDYASGMKSKQDRRYSSHYALIGAAVALAALLFAAM